MPYIIQYKGQIGDVRSLAGQWPHLGYGNDVVSVHRPLLCGDSGMSEGIVALDSEPAEIFQDVDFHSCIVGGSKVERGIVEILSFGNQPVFDRV